MTLSPRSIDTLIDLVEIKLSCFEVWDREDKRELQALQACRAELLAARRQTGAGRAASAATRTVAARLAELAA
jgi:ketosteroid isomerase-like protein